MYERWLVKGLWYAQNAATHIRIRQHADDTGFYYIILRKDNLISAKKLTNKLENQICHALNGESNTQRIRIEYVAHASLNT